MNEYKMWKSCNNNQLITILIPNLIAPSLTIGKNYNCIFECSTITKFMK